jgi:hypothetical protein
MKYKDPGFADRLSTAAEAKKAILAKFRAAPGPDDPEFAARQAEREAVAKAREVRTAARAAERAEQDAAAAAQAAHAAAEAAEREARETKARAERAVALEAEQKAARDARYAARKKRRRG